MPGSKAEILAAERLPPRDGLIIRKTTSAVAANLDLTGLLLPDAWDKNERKHVFLSVRAIGNDLWISTSDSNVVITTGGNGQGTTNGWRIPAGMMEEFEIDTQVDKVLNFIAAGAGEMYIYPSSRKSLGTP